MKKSMLFFVLLCIAVACKKSDTTEYYFGTSQPVNNSELRSIPEKFRGEYKNGDEIMAITDRSVIQWMLIRDTLAKSALDSIHDNFTYKNGKLVSTDNPDVTFEVIEKNDSLYITGKLETPLFTFSDSTVAKKIAGHLILNTTDSDFWKADILSVSHDSLVWRHLGRKEDFVKLAAVIKEVKPDSDTSHIYLNPTRKEFKKILRIPSLAGDRHYARLP